MDRQEDVLDAMNYLWNLYDENKIYGIASRGYLEVLQELVDKETPKKPIKKLYGHYKCPVCDNCWDPRDWKSKYCELCGQRLDWSEVE